MRKTKNNKWEILVIIYTIVGKGSCSLRVLLARFSLQTAPASARHPRSATSASKMFKKWAASSHRSPACFRPPGIMNGEKFPPCFSFLDLEFSVFLEFVTLYWVVWSRAASFRLHIRRTVAFFISVSLLVCHQQLTDPADVKDFFFPFVWDTFNDISLISVLWCFILSSPAVPLVGPRAGSSERFASVSLESAVTRSFLYWLGLISSLQEKSRCTGM